MRERFTNPVVGDDIILRFYTYNSNNLSNVEEIEKVEIFVLDDSIKSDVNPQGLRLVETITDITASATGEYSVTFNLDSSKYVIGNYVDRWHVNFETNVPTAEIDNYFKVYPNLWYTDITPVVYDFNFNFRPNRLRKGSIQYLMIEISPIVPTASDLQRYYQNLAIASNICISLEQTCNQCLPEEEDLRLILDNESVSVREKNRAFYQLDTVDLDLECGLYNVWFRLDLGGNIYLSDKMQLQIYD